MYMRLRELFVFADILLLIVAGLGCQVPMPRNPGNRAYGDVGRLYLV